MHNTTKLFNILTVIKKKKPLIHVLTMSFGHNIQNNDLKGLLDIFTLLNK